MRKVKGVIACYCTPDCTSFVFNDEAPLSVLGNARTVAWHKGMRFRGPQMVPRAESLDDTISDLALKAGMTVDKVSFTMARHDRR